MAHLGEGSSSKPHLSLGFQVHLSFWMLLPCMLAQQVSPLVLQVWGVHRPAMPPSPL